MRLAFAYFDENGDNKVSEDEFIYCILPDSKKKSKKHSFLSSFITKSHQSHLYEGDFERYKDYFNALDKNGEQAFDIFNNQILSLSAHLFYIKSGKLDMDELRVFFKAANTNLTEVQVEVSLRSLFFRKQIFRIN